MLNLKNALRWVKTANALVLVGCAFIFAPQSALAQCTGGKTTGDRSHSAGGGCAEGTRSIAIGVGAVVTANVPGTTPKTGIAIGADATASHIYSTALGGGATTTADNQMVFGASRERFRIPSTGVIANRSGVITRSYRFSGLAISEAEAARLSDTVTLPSFASILTETEFDAFYDSVNAYRENDAPNRVLGINGHGDLVSLGNVGDFMGSGSSYDDSEVRGLIGNNRDSIGALDTRLTQGLEKNAQGVALSNALSAIPNYLEPGKKLFLGIGAGSFDGKSATAIGVTGKFGASTLLNAGFATGGGESSTRIGIGWSW